MMKKRIAFWGCVLLFLCSCGKTQTLNFPKTSWDMTPEEVLEAYQIEQEDTAFYKEQGRSTAFMLENQKVFGEIAQTVTFNFMNMELEEGEDIRIFDEKKENGKRILLEVTVSYPKTADMEQVEENMEKLYGEKALSKMSIFSVFDVLGTETLNKKEYSETEEQKLWGSEKIVEVIDEKENVALQKKWQLYFPNLQKEQWNDFSENGRLVTVILKKSGENPSVKFDGYNQAVYQALVDGK